MRLPQRARRSRLGALAVFALVLAACGGDDSSSGSPGGDEAAIDQGDDDVSSTAEDAPSSSSGADSDAGSPAPPGLANATTVDGDEFDVASVTGRPTVAWFWAPWCTICRGEAPGVAQAADEYRDDVTFVGVAGLGDVADMQAFVDETGTEGFTHVADMDGSIWQTYGVYSQPAFAFVDANGEITEVTGGMTGSALTDRIDELIAG